MLERLGQKLILKVGQLGPVPVAFDLVTVIMCLIVSAILVLLALWFRRAIPADPEAPLNRRAAFLVGALDFFREQLLGGFPRELAQRLFPLITTLFLYVLLSNWISVIPGAQSPTQNEQVTLGFAFMVYFLSHYYAIRTKGARSHFRGYLEPYPFLLPMNVIGDFGRTLSHGFRLFGNIFGGAILTAIFLNLMARIITAVPVAIPFGLVFGVGLGTFLNAWFGVFIGAVQALVFALLASVYIRLTTA